MIEQTGVADEPLDLRQYLTVLRTRKWSILAAIAVVVAAAAAFSFSQVPIYSANTQVLVQPIMSDPSEGLIQQVDPTTESQVVASEPVALIVQEDLGADLSVAQLLAPLQVEGVESVTPSYSTGARVLSITYVSSDRAFARDAANAFADGYIEFRRNQLQENVSEAREEVETRIESASDQLARVTTELEEASQTDDDGLVSTLETQRNILIARLGVLQQRLDDVQPSATEQTGGAQILESAVLPSAPSSPDHFTNLLLSVFVGLGIGIVVAFLRERLDNRFRGRSDVETAMAVPVLGTVPAFSIPRKKGAAVRPVTLVQPRGLVSEAYRSLRTNIEFTLSQRGVNSLVVTSASESEGKTSTTMNLAVVMAQAGRRVVLVSADLRRPTIEKHLEVSSDTGLSTVLMNEADLWSVVLDPGIPNLRVIPSGPIPQNPAELLTGPTLPRLIRALEQNCDVLLIDTPPALAVADPAIIAGHVGGTLFVIDATRTDRPPAIHAREEIERAGGRLVGVVMNAFDPSNAPYSYGTYGSYYSTYYSKAGSVTNGHTGQEETDKKGFIRRRLRTRS